MSITRLDVQRHFTTYAEAWSSSAHRGANGAYPLATERADVILEMLRDVPAGSRVLDLGCGPGVLLAEVAKRGHESVGVDFSESMLEIAQKKVAGMPHVAVNQQDINEFLDECEFFDVIIAAGVIYYQEDLLGTLKRVARKMQDAGMAIVSFRNGSFRRSADRFVEQVIELSDHLATEDWADWIRTFSLELSEMFRLQKQDDDYSSDQADGMRQTAADPGTEPRLSLPAHTGEEIAGLAKASGLRIVEVVGVHPHILHPAFDDDRFVGNVDRISRPLGVFRSSHFDWFSHLVVRLEHDR